MNFKKNMNVKDSEFNEKVIEKSKTTPVVVDFWAGWCVPCNMLAPALEKVVDSYDGKVILAKVNVDECPETSNKFMIEGIPAIKIFKNGEIVEEFVGVQPEDSIRNHIDKVL